MKTNKKSNKQKVRAGRAKSEKLKSGRRVRSRPPLDRMRKIFGLL
jgi:hypothetical protein